MMILAVGNYVGDDGMNYATRIVFTAVDDYPESDFTLDPSLGEPDPVYIEPEYVPEPEYIKLESAGEDTTD